LSEKDIKFYAIKKGSMHVLFSAPDSVMLDDFGKVKGLEEVIRKKFPNFVGIDFFSINRYFNLNADDFDPNYDIHYVKGKHQEKDQRGYYPPTHPSKPNQ
jgi:hypothetical protein